MYWRRHTHIKYLLSHCMAIYPRGYNSFSPKGEVSPKRALCASVRNAAAERVIKFWFIPSFNVIFYCSRTIYRSGWRLLFTKSRAPSSPKVWNFAFSLTLRAATLFSAADVARAKFIFFNSQCAATAALSILKSCRERAKTCQRGATENWYCAFLRLYVVRIPLTKAPSAALQLVLYSGDATEKKLDCKKGSSNHLTSKRVEEPQLASINWHDFQCFTD
jgi:hypothetical protein